jgi:transposase
MSLQAKSLFMAMELSKKKWKLAFGDGSRERERTIPAGAVTALSREVEVAKAKLGLPADAPVISGYEAGRDGFWIDRMLKKQGVKNYVMDPASIEVSRQARRRKTDRLDAKKLLKQLLRKELGEEQDAFAAARVPTEAQEADLRLHRERERLVKERTGHQTRIRSLLMLHGIQIQSPVTVVLESLRDWEGKPLSAAWRDELRHEQQRLLAVKGRIDAIEKEQIAALADPKTPALEKASKLYRLRAVGIQSAWLLSLECFAWRIFQNRKQVGAFAGLTGTPYDSGQSTREQGISKAGNRRVRRTMIELAWSWVRWQPNSALSRWFVDRFVRGNDRRSKRKGIVALARKLLVALWKYVEQDIVPEGATFRA